MNDGRKKKPQKHQNKTAFKIQFDTLAINHQKKVSLTLLCKRCAQQISWKLQFNKYKKIAQASKCNYCHDKVVVRSYMKSCDPCAEREGVCPKCLNKDAEMPEEDEVKLSVKEQAQKDKQDLKIKQEYFDSLRQRSKRKVLREEEKDIIQWSTQLRCFIDKQGNEITGLKFKSKGLDDLDKQMDEEEDDEQNDQFQGSQQANQQNQNKQEVKDKKQSSKKEKVEQNVTQNKDGNDEDWEDQQLQGQDLDQNDQEDDDLLEEQKQENDIENTRKDKRQANQQNEKNQKK